MATKVDDAGSTSAIMALIHLIATADEFKANTNELSKVLGIKQAKNCPRKINSIIEPLGYVMRAGRIVAKEGENNKPGKELATMNGEQHAEDDSDTKPNVPKTPRRGKKEVVKTPASKKRKSAAVVEEKDSVKLEDDLEEDGNGEEG